MLGEKIGEISGKVTMQRVLPNLGGDPKMETSFQATGSVLGTNIKDTGTYSTIFRPDGTQYGEGQGIMITKDGKRPLGPVMALAQCTKTGPLLIAAPFISKLCRKNGPALTRSPCYSSTQ